MSQLSIFKAASPFSCKHAFLIKKLWLTFWGLSWSSLRATVVSIAVGILVTFNHCLQSPDLTGSRYKGFPCRASSMQILFADCNEVKRANPVLVAPYTWFFSLIVEIIQVIPFYSLLRTSKFCYTGNVQNFIFILMNCCWESPSLFEPNHFVSLISQIAAESITLLHNHECGCIIKHLSLSYTQAEFKGVKESTTPQ